MEPLLYVGTTLWKKEFNRINDERLVTFLESRQIDANGRKEETR